MKIRAVNYRYFLVCSHVAKYDELLVHASKRPEKMKGAQRTTGRARGPL
jgi:hypothetical protein